MKTKMTQKVKGLLIKFVYNPMFSMDVDREIEYPIAMIAIRAFLVILLIIAGTLFYYGNEITTWIMMGVCLVVSYAAYQYLFDITNTKV